MAGSGLSLGLRGFVCKGFHLVFSKPEIRLVWQVEVDTIFFFSVVNQCKFIWLKFQMYRGLAGGSALCGPHGGSSVSASMVTNGIKEGTWCLYAGSTTRISESNHTNFKGQQSTFLSFACGWNQNICWVALKNWPSNPQSVSRVRPFGFCHWQASFFPWLEGLFSDFYLFCCAASLASVSGDGHLSVGPTALSP